MRAYTKDIILFDGVCNLCNGTVNFVIDRDKNKKFLFGSLQSELAFQLLSGSNIDPNNLDSIVLLTVKGQVLQKSDAVLAIAWRMGGLWKGLSFFKIIPRFIRDAIYNWIASNRYKWFGQEDACRIPTPELADRFIEAN